MTVPTPVREGLKLCYCHGIASGECAGCGMDLADVEEHYDDGDLLWCAECAKPTEDDDAAEVAR